MTFPPLRAFFFFFFPMVSETVILVNPPFPFPSARPGSQLRFQTALGSWLSPGYPGLSCSSLDTESVPASILDRQKDRSSSLSLHIFPLSSPDVSPAEHRHPHPTKRIHPAHNHLLQCSTRQNNNLTNKKTPRTKRVGRCAVMQGTVGQLHDCRARHKHATRRAWPHFYAEIRPGCARWVGVTPSLHSVIQTDGGLRGTHGAHARSPALAVTLNGAIMCL